MITLHFGRYNGRKDVVKKLDIVTANNELFVIPRTPFDPLNPTFTLTFSTPIEHAMYNYGWFEYHAKKYCGWLNWTAIQDTTYTVDMYIDPVVTAYENGCMSNVFAKTIYSDFGWETAIDNRLDYLNTPQFKTKKFTTNADILQSARFYAVRVSGFYPRWGASASDSTNEQKYKCGNSDRIYITTSGGVLLLYNHMLELKTSDQKMFWNSIRYVMPLRGVTANMLSGMPKRTHIELTTIADPFDFNVGSDIYRITIPLSQNGQYYETCYECDRPITFSISCDTSDVLGKITDGNMSNNININIDHLASIDFTPLELDKRLIKTISVNVTLDCYAEAYFFELQVSGTKFPHKFATYNITEKIPFISAPSNDNIDAMFNLINGVGSSIAGMYTQAQTPSGGSGVANGIVNGASSLLQPVGLMLSGVVGNATPMITSSNLAGTLKSGVFLSFLTYKERTTKADYQKMYGYPDGFFRDLSKLYNTGYVMTDNVQLKTNNLPIAIIQQAEAQLNGGVWFNNPT